MVSFFVLAPMMATMDDNSEVAVEESQEVIFTVKNVAIMQFADKVNFITASTLSYFLATDSYYAEQFNTEQYFSQRAQAPDNVVDVHAVSYITDDEIAELHHSVKIDSYTDGSTLHINAGDATYNLKKNLLISNEAMQVKSPQGIISANAMKIDVMSQSIDLFNQVHSVFTFAQ